MSRSTFGGTINDSVARRITLLGHSVDEHVAASLTVWSALTGGTQYTDLLVGGVASSVVPVGSDGQVPEFQGPDGVVVVYVSAGGPRVKMLPAEGPGDASTAGNVTSGPLTKAALTATYVPKSDTQSAEGTSLRSWKVLPLTSGAAPFETGFNSYDNSGGGAGTKNHAFHMGYNIGRHNGGTVAVPTAPSWYMGFEDNYYDPADDLSFGAEWYVSFIPYDEASVGVVNYRPFYCRVIDSHAGKAVAKSAEIHLDIGTGANGVLAVYAGITTGTIPFQVTGTQVITNKKLLVNLGAEVAAGKFNVSATISPDVSLDRLAVGVVDTTLPFNSNGAYVGWANSISGTLSGDLLLIPRTSVAGSTRLYAAAGGGSPTLIASAVQAGFTVASVLISPQLKGNSGANKDLLVIAGSSSGSVVFMDSTLSNSNLTIDNSGILTARDTGGLACFGATGFVIGTSATQKFGFWGKTPVARPTGWAAATGTATRTTFVTSTVTLPQLAEHVKALIDDLTTIGVIGA